jgi:hypothetical protein
MLNPGRGQGGHVTAKGFNLATHGESSLSLQDQINLVFTLMDMGLLLLTCFKTVNIAEEAWCVKKIDLFHLLLSKPDHLKDISTLHLSSLWNR